MKRALIALGICLTASGATLVATEPTFIRGDANRDGGVDISDAIGVLGYLFLGDANLTCDDAADANDDGGVNISDPVSILGALFLGEGSLPPPYPEAGVDPTEDGLRACNVEVEPDGDADGVADSTDNCPLIANPTQTDSDADGLGDACEEEDCNGASTSHLGKVVCAANAFLSTLSSAQQTAVSYLWTDSVAKTRWSNLPGVTRNGLKLGSLGTASREAALAVAKQVLTASGYVDLEGVLRADDYLGTQGGGGPGGGSYSSDNYIIAFIGTPSISGDWMLQIGGHHMAFNVTYSSGIGYPTPHHMGVEPKVEFSINGSIYAPLAEEGAAMAAVFKSLDSTQLNAAYLSGQIFADVLLGPDEYGTGSYATVSFPAGANRKGVLVSSLSAEQQGLVTAAIEGWVRDYDPAIADPLLAVYTSAVAYGDTFIAWAGTLAQGVNVDISGTYMRIDGPRLWIEISCQSGVVIRGQTHYHAIFRDKQTDYGGSL